jgi:hypothetical protein
VWFIFLLLVSASAQGAVCGESEVFGPYGVQHSGDTTIAETKKPAVALARLVFNEDKTVSGYSSVNFDGLLLGNPVTGTYQTKQDCTMSWSLQDDSGAYQHFAGTITPGGSKVTFQQTDPGTGQHGVMMKTSDACTAADLRSHYAFTIGNVKSALTVAADGTLKTAGGEAGTIQVDPDCIVHLEFAGGAMKLRGVLVDRGAEILSIQIDPGKTLAVRFTAR